MTKTKKKLFLAMILVAILCIGIGTGILLSHNRFSDTSGHGVTLDTNAVNLPDDTSEQSASKYIRFPGYSDITLKNTDTVIPIMLTNPKVNPCYFSFYVTVDDDENPVLESDWVSPGKAIESVTLKQPLTSGTHMLHVKIDTRDLTEEKPMNGGNVEIPLHVE